MFMHSAKDGAKKSREIINDVQTAIDLWNSGVERLFYNCDGALRGYDICKYFVLISHPDNPDRQFRSCSLLTGVVGHTRMEADGIGRDSRKCWKAQSTWRTCEERVDYLNDKSNIEAVQMTSFQSLSANFRSLFIRTDEWVDEYGDQMLIEKIPALQYEFGESKVWNRDLQTWEWISHGNEIWARFSTG